MKILVLIVSLLSMSIAYASSDYDEILHHVGKGNNRTALALLENYLDVHPPMFRSHFLLGLLYLENRQVENSIKALGMVPEQERGAEYWFLKLNAYLKSSDHSTSRLRDMGAALDRVVEGVSFLPEGADETLFEAAIMTGGGRVKAICERYALSEDPRCGK